MLFIIKAICVNIKTLFKNDLSINSMILLILFVLLYAKGVAFTLISGV